MTTTPGQAPTGGAAAEQTGSYPAAASPLAPADQAPMVPGAPPVKQTERPHPLTPLIRGWLIFLAFFVYFLRDLGWILPIVGAVVVIAGVAGLFSWYFTRFVIDDEELRIETGWVFKKSKK